MKQKPNKEIKAVSINTDRSPDIKAKKKILKARAATLAKPLEAVADHGAVIQGLGFLLSDEQYLIDSSYVVEVLPLMELTPLPGVPVFILGIINVRGRILSVVNLKNFLELPEKGITNLNRVIVVRKAEIEIGLLVDEVSENVEVYMNQLQTGLSTLTSSQKEFLIGVTKDRSVVLDIAKFLEDEKIIINEEI